jgi:pimeloyl-ACP methyl ester carboxylesterase
MNRKALLACLVLLPLIGCTNSGTPHQSAYAPINGLRMYYEIHGAANAQQPPLILLHGGGSTIQSTFGRILPDLAKSHQLIAIETQAHGHTPDIDRSTSAEQDADDVAALLKYLHIEKADFCGFSNGGTDCLQIAIRHHQLVRKLVLLSPPWKRDSFPAGFFEGFKNADMEKMLPPPLKDAYLQANPNRAGLQKMFDRDVARMLAFQDIPDANIKSIQAPALVINGDNEVIRVESALALSRTLPHAQLVILPGGHGDYIGEIEAPDKNSQLPQAAVIIIEEFLNR